MSVSNASQQTFGASYSARVLPVIKISVLRYKINKNFDLYIGDLRFVCIRGIF